MKNPRSLLAKLFLAIMAACLAAGTDVRGADESFMKGRRFAATDFTSGKVCIVEADGRVGWSHPAKNANDVWILPGGSLLFSVGNGVKEVGFKDNAVKFSYSPGKRVEVYATQRLANGNTFVGECSTGLLKEVAPDGRVVKTVSLIPPEKAKSRRGAPGGHGFMRNARVLANGNYLVTHHDAHEVAEYNPEGVEVWRFKVPAIVHSAARLANGNTLVMGGDSGTPGIYEVSPGKVIVWQVTNEDLPGKPLRYLTGFQVLPNGNVLASNWLGHGQLKKAPHLLEITRSKKIVWTYNDHEQFKTISSVHVFEEGDKPLAGEGTH